MIGRFGHLGVYHELSRSKDIYRVGLGGLLGLAGYLWDLKHEGQTTLGLALMLASLAVNGLPIVWGAMRGLVQRRVNVDELVSLALIASILLGEFSTAVVVSFVMVLGSLIERITSGAAQRAIQSLMNLAPEEATLLVDGKPQTVPVKAVKVGDILLVRPGERIPVDATVVAGVTAVDESSMTGEPIPKQKASGDAVYAGTLNQNGVIEIEAQFLGEDTTLGKVIRLVSAAESFKPRAISLVDRYAAWFTPTILVCSGVAWLLTGEVSRAVTVLIVGCPCALILAAPTAIVAAIGRAAGSGILVKGGRFLEEAGRTDVVLFDKTGTLTAGQPRIGTILPIDGVGKRKVLSCAASVEQDSTHPLARAVLKAALYARVTLSRAEEMVTEIGLGVRACVDGRLVEVGSAYIGGGTLELPPALRQQIEVFKEKGETPLVVYEDRQPLGVMSVSDPVRPSARETVRRLKSLGIQRVGILSGDHGRSVHLVAQEVGLTDAWSEQKPQDKLGTIRDFQASGKTVLFVGDGINDAPALATANVGIAMGAAGTDVALETADVALMHDDISKIPFLIELGRKTLRTIKWNIAFGLLFNVVAILAGGWGILSPVMGAIVHNIGSVIVVASSASIAFVAEKGPSPLP
ncbi:MAG: cation-translocating P-type ATPase [Desulfomonile tiedjei]|nr:cation-translocating P-type ATPase [Desulfomonile tiedjei]